MARTRGKILVVRGGAVGDFILTLPVLAALRAQFPETHLEVLGYPQIARLALAAGHADAMRAIESRPLAQFFARHGTLDPDWMDYFASFGVVISYLYDPDEIFRTNLARCPVRQILQGPHRPASEGSAHATTVFLEPLQKLAIFDADPVPRIAIPLVEARDPFRVAIHPGSGGREKNWPVESWSRLIERLCAETGWTLALVGGEVESPYLHALAKKIPPDRLRLLDQLPLDDLAQELSQCALFVGHDSGISHLAAAVDLPSLLLWGPTREAVWRPMGGHVRTLKHDAGLAALDVETVRHQLGEMMRLSSR